MSAALSCCSIFLRNSFWLPLDVVEPETLGDRRVDLERLAGDRPPARRRHRLDGAHVVGAIGQLDEDHPQVAHHRQQHLAEGLGLRLLAALELDLVELGHPIDQLGDIGAEARRQLVLRRRGVLDDIVQDRRDDGVGVEVQVGEDGSRRHRVSDEGLAGEAFLSLVNRGAELGGLADASDLLGRQIAAGGRQQLLQPRGASSAGQQSQERRRIVHRQRAVVSLRVRTAGRGSWTDYPRPARRARASARARAASPP
jgi:hypothetical protein